MTDRELLKLAAKEAGIEYTFGQGSGCALDLVKPRGFQIWWNPLTDDGDALRLAVKLRIDVTHNDMFVMGFASEQGTDGVAEAYHVEDPCAATRRAIVRSAAEIGRNIK